VRYPAANQFIAALPVVLGAPAIVREPGLLRSAVERPGTVVLGHEPFVSIWAKAAAGLHGIVTSHPLVDGNKRAGWFLANVLLELNGTALDGYDVDAAEALVMAVAAGELREVSDIASGLRELSPRS
jgi:death on curing protein